MTEKINQVIKAMIDDLVILERALNKACEYQKSPCPLGGSRYHHAEGCRGCKWAEVKNKGQGCWKAYFIDLATAETHLEKYPFPKGPGAFSKTKPNGFKR